MDELPSEVKKIYFENVEDFSPFRRQHIIEAAESLARSWGEVRNTQDYWNGLRVENIDKFRVEKICHAARTASESYRSKSALEEELNSLGLEVSQTRSDLELLKTCLDRVEVPSDTPDLALLNRLIDETAIGRVEEFLSECKALRDLTGEIGNSVLNPLDAAWKDRLAKIERVCISNDFITLNIQELQRIQKTDNELLEELKSFNTEWEPFFEAFPACREFLISDLQCAARIVREHSRAVLGLRNETTASPEATVIIRKAVERGTRLKSLADDLGKRVSLTAARDPRHLRKLASQIAGAGALRFFSSSYRSAKQTYRELSYSKKFDRIAAASNLRALADWLEEKEEFFNSPALSRVLGSHNLGLDTDFSAFGGLLSFFESVEHRLPGAKKLPIRRILKHGDQELLLSIPPSLSSTWESDHESLLQRIEELSSKKEIFETEVQKLSALLSDIPVADRMDLEGFRLLQSAIAGLHQMHAELMENEPVRGLLHDRFKGSKTHEADLEPEFSIAKSVLPASCHWKSLVIDLIRRGDIEIFRSKLKEFSNTSIEATDDLRALSDLTGQKQTHFLGDRTSAEIASFLERAIKNSAELYKQFTFATDLERYSKAGHPELSSVCQENSIALSELPKITKALLARSLAKRVYSDFGSILGRFQGTMLDELREKLAATDKTIITSTRQFLRQHIKGSAKPPSGRRIGKKSEWTELALIKNEISKRKRFAPVRDLTARSGKALQELKPCWMVSPLAVAQYIPRATVEFDLCIIDEASQMPPEDAFGALVRSKQAMIVGDTNQLPPTSFFRRMVDEEDADEDETVLDESVLELANAAFRPKRRLRWHYRSRHSGLIEFSNRLVYDDDLIVFPSAHENRKDMGVSLVRVDGLYKSGLNEPEAQAMVNAALDFMEKSPNRSLGIVTLNQKQRDLLIENMEYALRDRKKASDYIKYWDERNDGLESFFIKNLENVQGDERDVIFIGTVYGPAEPGATVMQRFGPINGLAGKRRLNVLFSRAKEQIVTFSSMTAADIRADENGNPGTYMLKRWLEYSATGVLDSGVPTQREPDSKFEVFVIDQIKAMGCEAIPQVGVAGYFIDIGVKHPNWPHGFILGVECDGASYHSSKSARDRDRLRQEVLERLGWHFHRIWSTDWFNDSHREAKRLRNVITQRLDKLKREAEIYSQTLRDTPLADDRNPVEDNESVVDEQKQDKDKKYDSKYEIKPGDTVYVRYLDEPEKILKVTLSEQRNDPSNGIVGTFEPLGEALLESEEGDKIDVLIGSRIRRAVVERVEREPEAEGRRSPSPEHGGTGIRRTERNNEYPKGPERSAGAVESQQERLDLDVQQKTSGHRNLRLNPDNFYDSNYQFTLRGLGIEIIDRDGPITHRHLCQKIARMHGFQRTGSQIRKTIWAAVHKERRIQRDPSGENIFWPLDQKPREVLEFRGLEDNGYERAWKYVPYPEKLGLAIEALSASNRGDPLKSMVSRLGLGRLTAKTKAELEELLREAKHIEEDDKN